MLIAASLELLDSGATVILVNIKIMKTILKYNIVSKPPPKFILNFRYKSLIRINYGN
jgi:hypothetical protein